MKLFFIPHNTTPEVNTLMRQACEKKSISLVEIDESSFSFLDDVNTRNSILYRASISQQAKIIEAHLHTNETISFHNQISNRRELNTTVPVEILMEDMNIPMPKTINSASTDKTILKEYVDYLNGFPIIVKVSGKSHGQGVLKVDSFDSLYSLLGFLSDSQIDNIRLKEFIKTRSSARLVVLGDRVIDTYEYITPEDDFRSNYGEKPDVIIKEYPEDIKSIAVRAVKAIDKEFGGVDLLFDKEGNPYIAEVNFPCNFARAQMLTGTPIAEMMIDFLVKKSEVHQ